MPDQAMFYVGDVADASGEKSSRVAQWLSRQVVSWSPGDREGTGSGRPRLLTWNTAVQVTITAVLARHGVSTKRAAKATRAFAHKGKSGAATRGASHGPKRLPGELFADGTTLLVIGPDESADGVVHIRDDADWRQILASEVCVFVNLNEHVERVREYLRRCNQAYEIQADYEYESDDDVIVQETDDADT